MEDCPQHVFQILSKRPKGFSRFKFPKNVRLDTSIATNADAHRIDDLLDSGLNSLKFVSIEPIHGNIDHDLLGLDWIIIGAETGNTKDKIIPEKIRIKNLTAYGKSHGILIFVKDNANWHVVIREFPKVAWANITPAYFQKSVQENFPFIIVYLNTF